MDPAEKLVALNRAWEALDRIRDIEVRFDSAKTKAEIARLLSELAEARAAIAVIKEALDDKGAEVERGKPK